jgi:minor extracellular serine protease Vpr
MTPHRMRHVGVLAAAATLAATAGVVGAVAAPATPSGPTDPTSDARTSTGQDTTSAIVQLSQPSLAETANGKKIGWSSTKTKNQRASLSAQRNAFRDWLRTNAPAAQVVGQYDVALNAVAVRLGGTSLSTLQGGPGVVSASYENRYAPTAEQTVDPDLALISGEHPADTPSDAGAGVKVGVIDTGIDITHPCFSDGSKPGPNTFTNSKVIVAKVFNRNAKQKGYTPAAIQDHGTHVAGTIACKTGQTATVEGATIPYSPSGVAPGALLGNYNVFPGPVEDASSEDILNAMQAAAEDGMDVINMSLGGGAHGVQDLLTHAVDNLDNAGIVVAVAAGNDGPGHYTVGSPGSAERALTAGASSVGHYVGTPVYAGTGTSGARLTTAATGDFAVPTTSPLTGTLVPVAGSISTALPFGDGCTAGGYDGAAKGFIALVARGTCSFGTKVFNAEKAGAAGVIVVNNVDGDPIAMAADEAFPTTIVAVNAPLKDAAGLAGQKGQPVTIGNQPAYTDSGNDLIMGDFSSQGPTDVDYRVKPDVTAPGVNVLSSIPQSFCDDAASKATGCWAFFQGTSMATPHLAGTAAVVEQQHPTWTSAQVRSAIVNTATEGVLTKSKAIHTVETDPLVTGSGQEDVLEALAAKVALSSVSTSFGAVPSGSGKTLTKQVVLTSLDGAAHTYALSVDEGSGLFKVSTARVTVPATGSATITVSFASPKATDKGDKSATLRLSTLSGAEVAHSVLYAFSK